MYSRNLHPRHCIFCGKSIYLCSCNFPNQEFREINKDPSLTAYTIIIHPDGSEDYIYKSGGATA